MPLTDIRSIGTSTYTIDRVVESGGLTRLDWISTLAGTDEQRLSAATAGATRREKKAAIDAAVHTAHDTAEAFAAAASASAEVDGRHRTDSATAAASGTPGTGEGAGTSSGPGLTAAPANAHATADVESYLRILDTTDALRVLSTVQSLIPKQEGSLA